MNLPNSQSTGTLGYIVLVGALGTMCTLLAGDISNLKSWNEVLYPSFIAGLFAHIGVVIAAFVSGKLVPDNRDNQMTRSTDVSQLPKTP